MRAVNPDLLKKLKEEHEKQNKELKKRLDEQLKIRDEGSRKKLSKNWLRDNIVRKKTITSPYEGDKIQTVSNLVDNQIKKEPTSDTINSILPEFEIDIKHELNEEGNAKNEIIDNNFKKKRLEQGTVISCPKCKYSTDAKHSENLTRHLRTVHENVRNFACERCSYTAKVKDALKQHEISVHDKIKSFSCDKCPYATPRKAHLHMHIKAKHEHIRDVKCDQCDYLTSDKSNLSQHRRKYHPKEGETKSTPSHSFKCYYCNHLSMYKQGVIQHMQKKHGYEGSTYEGPSLPLIVDVIKVEPTFKIKSSITENNKIIDQDQALFRIEVKKEEDTTDLDFVEDILQENGDIFIELPPPKIVKEESVDPDDLRALRELLEDDAPKSNRGGGTLIRRSRAETKREYKHKLKFEPKIELFCDQCNFVTNRPNQLAKAALHQHVKNVHPVETYPCDKCTYVGKRQAVLWRHTKEVHADEKKFPCTEETCAYSAALESTLKQHVNSVHRLRKFACMECEFIAKREIALKSHVKNVHTRIKDHECDQCEYKCSQKSNLTLHIKLKHTDREEVKESMLIKCDKCSYSTIRRGCIKRHTREVHDKIKDFICQYCSHAFSQKGHLHRHIIKMHPNDSIGADDD